MASESAAWPVADEALAQQLLDLVQQAGHVSSWRASKF